MRCDRRSLTQGGTFSSTYTVSPGGNRLSSVTGASTRIYACDVAGNATGDGTRSFTYNNAGRMTSVTNGVVTTSYAFDALGEGDIPVATFANALLRAQLCRHGRAFEPPRYALDAPGRRAACASKVAVKRQPSWRL